MANQKYGKRKARHCRALRLSKKEVSAMHLEWSRASVFDPSETLYLQVGAPHTGHFRYPYTEFCPDFSYTL